MAKLDVELGVQSWCFRAFDTHSRVIDAVRQCGLASIELCGKHVQPATSPDTRSVVKQYADAGIRISSFGVNRFTADEAAARKVFDFAKQAGFSAISTTVERAGADATFRLLERLGDEYNVNLAIHNHGRKDWLGAPFVLEDVFRRTSKRIGLCLDTAWMLDAGADPVKVAEQFYERLYGLHIKDFVFGRDGKPEDVIVGTGNLDLKALLALLKAREYQGYLTLEYEGDVNDPLPATRKCVQAVKAAAASV